MHGHPHAASLMRIATLCVLMLAAPRAHPQTFGNLGHQEWTTENGLPQNSVHQILQTRDGFLWVATEGGIARFDGVSFRIFNQENTPAFTTDDTCCLAQDSHGTLWIGTADGLVSYQNGAFRHYTVGGGSSTIEAIAINSDGKPSILSDDNLYVLGKDSFAPLPLTDSTKLIEHGQGGLYPLPVTLQSFPDGIENVATLPNNTTCILTRSSISLNENGHTRTISTNHDLPDVRIQSALADTHGNLWIGTSSGLFVLPQSTGRAQPIPALGTNSILSLFEDSEGDIWAGTETAGLHILRRQNFHTLPALSEHVITAVAQSTDGAMWAGTNGDGLDRSQQDNTQHFSAANGLLSDIILALAPGSNGSMWVGTPDGLNHIEGRKIESYTSADGLPDDLIRSLLVDSDGSLWIGTRRGLAHWKNNIFTTYTQADGLKSNLIGSLVRDTQDQQTLWIGTLDGLSRLRDGKITIFTTKDGLSGNIITSLLEDSKGTLWIGTKGSGLSRSTSNGFVSMQRHDLPRSIDAILEDNTGNLWLSSTHGITRVPRDTLIACGTAANCNPHPEPYGRADGMPTEEASSIGHPAAWKDTAGLLWFATRKGVAITNPAHLSEDRIPPPVVIESFTVDDAPIAPSSIEINIAPGHTRFAFAYAGLSFAAPSKVRYRYILEGFDKQWTDAGSRRTAYYTNLPPRHYRFRVQAATNSGGWNEAGAEIAFYVRPAFYRRAWFILLCLVLLAAIIVLLYRLRVRRLRSQFDAVLAERNRMAREIHDTLAQSFVGVSVQLELAAQLLAQSHVTAAYEQIDRTRAYVREGLAEARRSIWDLRAITAQDTLPTRLTRLADQTGTPQLQINLTIGGTYRPLAPAVETEVLRIAQEALANITRHAQATRAVIDLRYHSKRLTLTITDNGRGFDATNNALPANGHFGLQGMRERAEQIGANLAVNSTPGHGTSITLDSPIAPEKARKD